MPTNYDASLSGAHISANLDMYESARTGFFTFIVDDIDNIVRATYKGDPDNAPSSDRIAKAQEYLKLNVTAASVPHFSINQLEFKRGNDTIKFAGTPSWGSGSITVDDVIGMDTKSIIMAWHNLAYNVNTRKGGRMADYKKTCTLVEYTQDYEEIRSWILYGCWVSDISEDNFNKENDGKRQLSVTIQYDYAEMVLPEVEEA